MKNRNDLFPLGIPEDITTCGCLGSALSNNLQRYLNSTGLWRAAYSVYNNYDIS